jgi:hypothetical protein
MAKPLHVKQDNTANLAAALKTLVAYKVMVGVPAEKTDRRQEGRGKQITNAALSYIHNNGAPEVGIPARPFLIPGVKGAQNAISEQFRIAGRMALEGKDKEVMKAFIRAGLIAQNSVRKKITDGPFAPLKPATIAARKRRFKSRKNTQVRPLINTGQLRAAQTFVIRKV